MKCWRQGGSWSSTRTRYPQTSNTRKYPCRQHTRTEISTLGGTQALPRLTIECLAKWVACHDVQTERKKQALQYHLGHYGIDEVTPRCLEGTKSMQRAPEHSSRCWGGARSHLNTTKREHHATRKSNNRKNQARETFCYFSAYPAAANF
jgi:hypothetical protein